jgi:hypothetical protein
MNVAPKLRGILHSLLQTERRISRTRLNVVRVGGTRNEGDEAAFGILLHDSRVSNGIAQELQS